MNGMWNTPVPVLAAVFLPITLTAGPVAAYNVAMVLGPVVSGLALALALGVWIAGWWPRAVAGLRYGFSAGVIALGWAGVSPESMLFLVAGMCLVAAWIAHRLHRACARHEGCG